MRSEAVPPPVPGIVGWGSPFYFSLGFLKMLFRFYDFFTSIYLFLGQGKNNFLTLHEYFIFDHIFRYVIHYSGTMSMAVLLPYSGGSTNRVFEPSAVHGE